MLKTIYLVKQLRVLCGEFEELDIQAFSNEDLASEFLNKELNTWSEYAKEHTNMSIFEDGFSSVIYNIYGTIEDNLFFDLDVAQVDIKDDMSDEIYVYNEINICKSGEISTHTLPFINKEVSVKELKSEVNNRSNPNSNNYYKVSDKWNDEDFTRLELKDEEGNISFLENFAIKLNNN